MAIPLRGEMTLPASSPPTQVSLDQSLEHIQGLLSQFVRLSRPSAVQTPHIIASQGSLDDTAHDASATWTWTAAEAASTESALFPFLIHLASARDDVESLNFTIDAATNMGADSALGTTMESQQYKNIAAGIVNCLEGGSGRAPLHVAALNGSTRCALRLLESGALVHLRDALGHTALYYVRAPIVLSYLFLTLRLS
jgi:lysophospholipase